MTIFFTTLGVSLLVVYFVYYTLSKKIKNLLNGKELLSSVDEEVQALILDLNQTTERNLLLIEESIGRLTTLIKESKTTVKLLDKRSSGDYSHLSPIKNLKKSDLSFKQPLKEEPINTENIDKKEMIIGYHTQGIGAQIIASKTGYSIGEIELIISLSRGMNS